MDESDHTITFDRRLLPVQWTKVNRSVPAGKIIVFPNGARLTKGHPPPERAFDFMVSGLYSQGEGKWVIQFLKASDGTEIFRFWHFDDVQVTILRHLN